MDFSRASGIPHPTVSTWFRGVRLPDPDSCDRIAEAFHVDVDVVLEKAGHRPELEPDTELMRDLIALVRQVRWNAEREWLIRGQLTSMVELDQQRRVSTSKHLDGTENPHQ